MVTIDQVERGIAAYLDRELMPILPDTGFQKVLIGTGIGLALRKYKGQLAELKDHPVVKMLGVFDKNGNVDIDVVKEELGKQIPETGLKMELPMIGGLTFHKADVDKLHSYIVNSPTLQ